MKEVVDHGGLEGGVGFDGLVPGSRNGSLEDGQDVAGDGPSHVSRVEVIQIVVVGDGGIGGRGSEGCRGEEQSGESLVLHCDGVFGGFQEIEIGG